MVKRYGDDAALEAAKRADELLAEGDADGCAVWKQILTSITELQAGQPGPKDSVH